MSLARATRTHLSLKTSDRSQTLQSGLDEGRGKVAAAVVGIWEAAAVACLLAARARTHALLEALEDILYKTRLVP